MLSDGVDKYEQIEDSNPSKNPRRCQMVPKIIGLCLGVFAVGLIVLLGFEFHNTGTNLQVTNCKFFSIEKKKNLF